jgi:hypothetical protein
MTETNVQLPLPLRENEKLIGYYENDRENAAIRVYVTTNGIIWRKQAWTRIDYSDIEDVRVDQEKTMVDRLLLQSANGEATIPIMGGEGRLRDAWIVLQFLRQCRSDIDKGPA